jgi:glycosyltransferase involved in cell wall biosynthesis
MKIGIDARFFGSLGKGLGRYTQKLIENLEKISARGGPASGGGHQYFVFLRKENFNDYQPKNKNFQKVLSDYPWYSFSEQVNMPRILNKYKLDLVHFPHFNVPLLYRKKFIITIHDLILLHFSTLKSTTLNPIFYWLKFLAYKAVIRSAVKRSKKIIAVSNFTKSDILNHYSIPQEKIVVTHEATDDIQENSAFSSEGILKKYGIMKPYIMYVGNAYPHKNLEALVLAYRNIKNKKLQLVLVGKEDYFYSRLKELTEKEKISNVLFAGFVPDEELDVIYKNSLFYIFPSLYEGFGLPPLEAMIRGIPVAASNIPCLKEILGENAFYFDASKKENISRAIDEYSENQKLREELSGKGILWTKKYSWEKMAKETLNEYER